VARQPRDQPANEETVRRARDPGGVGEDGYGLQATGYGKGFAALCP
jgi:hypothetical protein